MKYDCDVVKDLLPIYQDNLVSAQSRSVVEEHLTACVDCREYADKIKLGPVTQAVPVSDHEGTPIYVKLARKLRIRRTLLSICLVLLILGIVYGAFCYSTGKRFNSLQAAQSSHWIDEKSKLLGEVDFGAYRVYLYENEDKYRTVATKYAFPLWGPHSDSWANKTDDKIKLVGWCCISDGEKGITVVPIQSFDERVAYVEMGSGENYIRKDANVGNVVVFAWDKGIPWNDLNAVAYSAEGKALYKLGYEVINSTVHVDEFRWLPIND